MTTDFCHLNLCPQVPLISRMDISATTYISKRLTSPPEQRTAQMQLPNMQRDNKYNHRFWHRRFVTGLLSGGPGSVHVGYLVNKVALGQSFL
jgi:hypothetical protein